MPTPIIPQFNSQASQYVKAKNAGTVTIAVTPTPTVYALSFKRFDSTTGEQLTNMVQTVALTDIQTMIAGLQGQLEDYQAFLADLQATNN